MTIPLCSTWTYSYNCVRIQRCVQILYQPDVCHVVPPASSHVWWNAHTGRQGELSIIERRCPDSSSSPPRNTVGSGVAQSLYIRYLSLWDVEQVSWEPQLLNPCGWDRHFLTIGHFYRSNDFVFGLIIIQWGGNNCSDESYSTLQYTKATNTPLGVYPCRCCVLEMDVWIS